MSSTQKKNVILIDIIQNTRIIIVAINLKINTGVEHAIYEFYSIASLILYTLE